MKYEETIDENGIKTVALVPETREEKMQMEAHTQFWKDNGCTCEDESSYAHYVDDNDPDGLVSKHHWICNTCGGIVQIG